MKKFKVLRQDWVESERGWGIRPDGYSLHLNSEDLDKFVRQYWSRMPDQVPDEYSRPSGEPVWVEVDGNKYLQVQESDCGEWFFR